MNPVCYQLVNAFVILIQYPNVIIFDAVTIPSLELNSTVFHVDKITCSDSGI
jgi:hypothetical protein